MEPIAEDEGARRRAAAVAAEVAVEVAFQEWQPANAALNAALTSDAAPDAVDAAMAELHRKNDAWKVARKAADLAQDEVDLFVPAMPADDPDWEAEDAAVAAVDLLDNARFTAWREEQDAERFPEDYGQEHRYP